MTTTQTVDDELAALKEPESVIMPDSRSRLSDEDIPAIEDPKQFAQHLEVLQRQAPAMTPADELSVKQCAALIETCTIASRYAEKRRTDLVKPLNTKVKEYNATWMPIVEGFDSIAKQISRRVTDWVQEQRRQDEARQRKALEDARREREELERKAEAERQEAERIRLEAERKQRDEEARQQQVERDRLAAEEQRKVAAQAIIDAKNEKDRQLQQSAYDRHMQEQQEQAARDQEARQASLFEQERLEKEAAKLDTKAEKHEVASTYVTPDVLPQQAKTIDIGSSKLVTKAPKKTWLLPGWDKQKPLKITDAKLAALVGDLDALPPGVRFLLQHADLNPVHLNKSFGVLKFPHPFGEVDDLGGAALRQSK